MQRALTQATLCLQRSSRCSWSIVFATKLNWHYAVSHNAQAHQLSPLSHIAVQSLRCPHVSVKSSTSSSSCSTQRAWPSAMASLERPCWYSTRSSVDQGRTETPYTISNAISLLRLVSAPGVAWLIATEQWDLAMAAVALAGEFRSPAGPTL